MTIEQRLILEKLMDGRFHGGSKLRRSIPYFNRFWRIISFFWTLYQLEESGYVLGFNSDDSDCGRCYVISKTGRELILQKLGNET